MPSFIDGPTFRALLRPSTNGRRNSKISDSVGGGGSSGGGIFKMFKLMPMLSSGCKMVALLGKHNSRALLADHATTVTLFGHRRGRVSLAIHEDTRAPPLFLIELPMLTSALHREISSSGVGVKLALESDTRSARRRLVEEYVWAVYCNGRKAGYAIRRKEASDDERHVLRLLRGVSQGAGVLPAAPEKEGGVPAGPDGELTYVRARVERVVGSKDSEAFYMINPEEGGNGGGDNNGGGGGGGAPELSIFLKMVPIIILEDGREFIHMSSGGRAVDQLLLHPHSMAEAEADARPLARIWSSKIKLIRIPWGCFVFRSRWATYT